jgi:hypothetical protein
MLPREIHIHIQIKHLVVICLLLLVAFGATTALAYDSDNPVAQRLQDSFRPVGQVRIATDFKFPEVTCGYFGICPPASTVTINVPAGRKGDLFVMFTATADTTAACNVLALLDGHVAFESDPYVFGLHDSIGGHTESVHWTLNDVPPGNHKVSIAYSESVDSFGSCSLWNRYLTVMANLH